MLAQRRHANRVAKTRAAKLAALPKKGRVVERAIGRIGDAENGFNIYTFFFVANKPSIKVKGSRIAEFFDSVAILEGSPYSRDLVEVALPEGITLDGEAVIYL